jgi:hypothetical protein
MRRGALVKDIEGPPLQYGYSYNFSYYGRQHDILVLCTSHLDQCLPFKVCSVSFANSGRFVTCKHIFMVANSVIYINIRA